MGQPTTAYGNRSLVDMRNLVYAKIRRNSSDPLSGLSQSYVDEYIAKWDAYVVDYARWNWPGFKKRKLVSYKSGTTVKTAFVTGDATFDLTDNTNASASGGRLAINGDFIDYSGKDSPNAGESVTVSTVTDALGIDVDHSAGERVEFLVPVPSDFGKPGEIWLGNTGQAPHSKLKHKDMRANPKPLGLTYFVDDDYLILPDNLTTGNLLLHYWKKGLKAVDGDELQTPQKWDEIVLLGAMAECKLVMGENDKYSELMAAAGLPNVYEPGADLDGLLQFAAGLDSEQTDSEDEIFEADLGTPHL